MILRQYIIEKIRRLGLAKLLDFIRYLFFKLYNLRKNNKFKFSHPEIKLPPDYLIYESFQLDYHKYYWGGKDTAKWLKEHFEKHVKFERMKILDWGCGPGRIIRHLSTLNHENNQYFATDYNEKSIAWCKQNINNVDFSINLNDPPLEYLNNTFDIVYGISILTHMAKESQIAWINEIERVLRPNGILFLTTHGDHYISKLNQSEKEKYLSGDTVIRDNTKEGHRTFVAFQPVEWMHHLLNPKFHTLEHIVFPIEKNKSLPQDVWIVKRK